MLESTGYDTSRFILSMPLFNTFWRTGERSGSLCRLTERRWESSQRQGPHDWQQWAVRSGLSLDLARTQMVIACAWSRMPGAIRAMPRPMRHFNTAGPCIAEMHYMLPPTERLPEAFEFIGRGDYFVLHAPRQSGKTTTLMATARCLTEQGRFAALHFSCETAEVTGDDHLAAQLAILSEMARSARRNLPEPLQPQGSWPVDDPVLPLGASIEAWAQTCPLPLVLFFDEIDALRGQSLLAVLRQLRSGFPDRPKHAPWSVVLCGLRDVRDYKMASAGDPSRLGTSSPFNIKVASLSMPAFSEQDVSSLYAQHTKETGQAFTPQAVHHAYELSQGQPWLVNALAREVVDVMRVPRDQHVTVEHVDEAKNRLIVARATHLDSLLARLQEDRVRRVLEPTIAGTMLGGPEFDDDMAYVRDLGLIQIGPAVEIANPIYREVIVRVLAGAAEANIALDRRAFVLPNGRLDMRKVLEDFAAFWKEHGEVLTGHMPYHEVAPQLVLMAFLQRVVNGGGSVDREYGIGRGRIDLLVRWPVTTAEGRTVQREALELKVWRDRHADPMTQGLGQLDADLASLELDTGVLVVFDRRQDALPTADRTRFETAQTPSGRTVTVLRLEGTPFPRSGSKSGSSFLASGSSV